VRYSLGVHRRSRYSTAARISRRKALVDVVTRFHYWSISGVQYAVRCVQILRVSIRALLNVWGL
jgi:hypothetical protein